MFTKYPQKNGSNINVPIELSADLSSGPGITLTEGHADIAAISYNNGAEIEAALTSGEWHDLVDINLGVPFEFGIEVPTVVSTSWPKEPIDIRVASDETSGDYLRLQIEIDDVVVLDFTNTSNATNDIDNSCLPLISGRNSYYSATNIYSGKWTEKMYANSRLRIRLLKNGTFDGSSYLCVGAIRYNKITV